MVYVYMFIYVYIQLHSDENEYLFSNRIKSNFETTIAVNVPNAIIFNGIKDIFKYATL